MLLPRTKDQRPKTKDLAAIILAAGQSKRMGAFKPLLPFGDKTVIESCIDYFNEGGIENIVVVLGHRAEDIRRRLDNLPVEFAFNPNPESAMSESIACGVRALPEKCPATFITPADYPAVPSEVVRALNDAWRQNRSRLLVPQFAGRGGHPILVDFSFREQLLSLDADRGLRGLLVDHRDDYRALHREVFGSEPAGGLKIS
jgi:molybdenum cofactor cytidylyltransferase